MKVNSKITIVKTSATWQKITKETTTEGKPVWYTVNTLFHYTTALVAKFFMKDKPIFINAYNKASFHNTKNRGIMYILHCQCES